MRPCASFVAASLMIGTAVAQTTDPVLTGAIAARDKASIARDAAGLAQYTADDYVAVNPAGALVNKQQRLDGLKTPPSPGARS